MIQVWFKVEFKAVNNVLYRQEPRNTRQENIMLRQLTDFTREFRGMLITEYVVELQHLFQPTRLSVTQLPAVS
jgi:hypothetical protein